MKSILVTGASGFVGTYLCRELESQGFKVRRIFHQLKSDDHASNDVQIDQINGETDWGVALQDVDVVIHLAARVHIMQKTCINSTKEYIEVNVLGTQNLTLQAAKSGVRRFIYLSSIKVNGEYTDGKPFTAFDEPNPQDPYAISKWQAEQALREISREIGMEVVIVRPPLVYGPGVKANFYNLLHLVSKALPLPLGSIQNRRSMIYLGNLVEALILCATHPKAAGQTYLVSDGQEVSTPQLVKNIASAMRRPSRVFPFPIFLIRLGAKLLGKLSTVDRLTQSLVIDSSKIREELGWQPPYTMVQGLRATADWYCESIKTMKH